MEKNNIAELLKDCPSGMELNCLMYEDVYFDYVDTLNIIHCYIQHKAHKTYLMFNQHGTPDDDIKSKCVIFPKGKTTWEGFVPPYKFKDGDVVATNSGGFIGIIEVKNNMQIGTYCAIDYRDDFKVNPDYIFGRIATEEEKKKLFQAIKNNGYRWNHETKTLEKLIEPEFKIGDKVRHKTNHNIVFTIDDIEEDFYTCAGKMALCFSEQDSYELVPNKFDVTTLKTFDKVLVRRNKNNNWRGSFFSHIDDNLHCHCYNYVTIGGKSYPMCIPQEGNEHLCGTTDDCDEYFKTW